MADLPARDVCRYWLRWVALLALGLAVLAGLCAWTGRGVPL